MLSLAPRRIPISMSYQYEQLYKRLSDASMFPHYTRFRDVEVLLWRAIEHILEYADKKKLQVELICESSLRFQYMDLHCQFGERVGLPSIRGKSDTQVRDALQRFFLDKVMKNM